MTAGRPASRRGAAAHTVGGRRDPQYQRAFPAPSDRGTPHRVRSGRPSRPHPRFRAARVHRGGGHRSRSPRTKRRGRLMADVKRGRRFGRVRRLSSGQYQARYRGRTGRPARAADVHVQERRRELADHEGSRDPAGEWIAPEPGARVRRLRLELDQRSRLQTPQPKPVRRPSSRTTWRRRSVKRISRHPRGDYPALAEGTPRRGAPCGPAVRAGDGGQGVPPAARHHEHGGRGRADRAQSVPDQGSRAGVLAGATGGAGRPWSGCGYVPLRYRALILLATFANLRLGELAGLRRDKLDLDTLLSAYLSGHGSMINGNALS